MNFVFISPYFPHTYWNFCDRLKKNGVNVLGVGDAPYDSLEAPLKAALDAFLNAGGGNAVVEEPDQNVVDVIDGLIAKIVGGTNVRESSRQKLVELVRFMDDKGIFLVRGSMEKVANLLGVSKVTLYSYLDEAKGKR